MTGCRVYWGSHGCEHPQGHPPEIPHDCGCCECVNHPDPDPDNPGSAPSCVAKPPYYGPDTRFYGEDAEALGLPLVSPVTPRELILCPVDAPYRFTGLSTLWSLVRMPDGSGIEGMGPTLKAAEADARRRWRRWKCRRTAPLAVNGHEYRKRCRARAKRRRAR